MKILKTDKRLIDEGFRYKIEGDLICDESIDLTDLNKPLYVTGSINAGEYIKADGSINAGEYINAGWYINAGEYINADGSINAGEYIKADGSINAGEYIKAGGSIQAGEYINAGWYINAGQNDGILAGLAITAKWTISFGLNLFCGTCVWRKISDEEKTVTCSKIIGGGEVAYGILNETGVKNKITIELTQEQLELIKGQGIL